MEKHKQDTHIGKGQGLSKKTGRVADLWICCQCNTRSGDNRAAWKHFRTQHLKLFIHYCPVAGCSTGSDQKDTIVSHIIKDHPTEQDLVAKCKQQTFLRCRKCLKNFRSMKGKNLHEENCGKPILKMNCATKPTETKKSLMVTYSRLMKARDTNVCVLYVDSP